MENEVFKCGGILRGKLKSLYEMMELKALVSGERKLGALGFGADACDSQLCAIDVEREASSSVRFSVNELAQGRLPVRLLDALPVQTRN